MHHMTPWVRQYSLRDLLDDSYDLFKERAAALMLAGIIPYTLIVLYTAIMRLFVLQENLLSEWTLDAAANALQSWNFWLFILGGTLVSSVAVGIGYIAQCRIATAHALGQDLPLPAAFRLLCKPLFSLLIIGAIYAVILSILSAVVLFILTVVGLFFSALFYALGGVFGTIIGVLLSALGMLVALGITVLASTFFLATPISLATRHTGPFTAIGDGFRYAAANVKAHFGALYVMMHMPMIFLPFIGLVSGLLFALSRYISPTTSFMVIWNLFAGLGLIFFLGITACLQALTDIDGRCRTEALDLRLMAMDIGLGDAVAEAMAQPRVAPAGPAYPNYAATSPQAAASNLTSPVAVAGYPNYAAAPPASDQYDAVPPVASSAFPDYSAPPAPGAAPVLHVVEETEDRDGA